MTVTRSTLRGLGDRVRTPCEAALDVAVNTLREIVEIRLAALPPWHRAQRALDQIAKILPGAVKP